MKTSQRGFSIIEVAVVMVVIGMMLATAVPAMSAWFRNMKLRNQAETIQAGLQQARNEAVRRNQPVSFYLVSTTTANKLDNNCSVAANGTSWVVSLRSPAGACGATPTASSSDSTNPLIVTARTGADGASGVAVNGYAGAVTDTSTAASSVTFDALGRRSGNLTHLVVNYASGQSADRPMRVDISSAGMVRMCDTQVSDSSDPRRCPTS